MPREVAFCNELTAEERCYIIKETKAQEEEL